MAIIHDSQLEIITSHLDIYISWRQPNGEFITESYIDEGMSIDEAIEKFKLKHEGK